MTLSSAAAVKPGMAATELAGVAAGLQARIRGLQQTMVQPQPLRWSARRP